MVDSPEKLLIQVIRQSTSQRRAISSATGFSSTASASGFSAMRSTRRRSPVEEEDDEGEPEVV